MRKTLVVALLITLTLPAGCGSRRGRAPGPQGVIVVLLDTLRADHLGCYGHDRPTSPEMDALALEGVRFEQVVSAAPWTLPSVTALLAGRYPERVWQDAKLTASLVEDLRAAGVRTAAFTEGGFVSRHFAHDRGFDSFVEEEGAVQLVMPGKQRDPQKQGGIERTFSSAMRWLEQIGDERFFLLIHTYEPHAPYTNRDFAADLDPGRIGEQFTMEQMEAVTAGELEPTESELEYLAALYDGDVLNADRYVGRLRNRLEQLGLDERVALIVTSDHGEELGEHYPSMAGNHGHSLLDTLLLVPLVIHDPSRGYPARVIDRQVRLIDVLPTAADLLGVTPDGALDGRSLLGLMRGDENADRLALAGQVKHGPWRVGVRWMRHKFIRTVPVEREATPLRPEPPQAQLFDLERDPDEQTNLAPLRSRMVRILDDMLREQHPGLDKTVSPEDAGAMDPELIERLHSLGYVD